MKTQKGIVWAPLLIIIGAVVVAGFSTYMLIQNNSDVEPENANVAVVNQGSNNTSVQGNINSAFNTNIATNTNTSEAPATDNTFDFDTAKVGDMVAGMKIVSIGKYRADADESIEPNRKVVFSGRATLTGTYYERGIPGLTLEKLTEESQKKLPRLIDETRSVWFSFTNQAAVRTALGDLETDGDGKEVTAVIDTYTINSYPSEVGNTAVFIEAVTNPTAGWKTYENTKHGFSFKYPSTWTITEDNSVDPSQTVYVAKDPTGVDGQFSVAPRGYPGSGAPEGTVTQKAIEFGTVKGTQTTLTLSDKSIWTSYVNLKQSTAPKGWEWAHPIHLSVGSKNSLEVLDLVLSTFIFTK